MAPTSRPPISGSSRSPVWNALTPCTAWNSWGSTNIRPIRANDASVASTVLQVNRADRNSASSISGSAVRVCQPTNAASTTAPAAIPPSVTASPQPRSPAAISPYVSTTRPAADSAIPSTSIRPDRLPRVDGISAATATVPTSTSGRLSRNTDPHQ